MAGARLGHASHGFLIPDHRIGPTTFVEASSTYTEASPLPCGLATPSDARSQLRVRQSGYQDADNEWRAFAAGMPSEHGCRLGYKVESAADATYRGWDAPNVARGWVAAEYSDAVAYEPPCGAVIPSTQDVVAVYYDATNDDVLTRTLDLASQSWSAAVTVAAYTTGHDRIPAVMCLPGTESLICVIADNDDQQAVLYYSNDSGATWTLGNRDILDVDLDLFTASPFRARLLYHGGDVLFVVIGTTASGTTFTQYASSSLGTTFTQILESHNLGGSTVAPDCCLTQSGYLVTVTVTAGADIYVYRVGSMWEAASNVTGVLVAAGTYHEVAVWSDYDGRVYLAARATQQWWLWVSFDEGLTWDECGWGIVDLGEATSYPTDPHFVAAGGCAVMLHRWVANPGDEDDSIGAFLLGGWSNCVMGTEIVDFTTDRVDTDVWRTSWGPEPAGLLLTTSPTTWLPIDRAGDLAPWTCTVAGGATEVLGSGYATITSAGGAGQYRIDATTAPEVGYTDLDVTAQLYVVSGGSLANCECGFQVRLSIGAVGATDEVAFEVRCDTTGFRIYDIVGAATLATVVTSLIRWTDLRIIVRDKTDLQVLYRLSGATTWTEGVEATLATQADTASRRFSWGHPVAGTCVSRWRMLGYYSHNTTSTPRSLLSSVTAAQTMLGRQLTSRPYPLGDWTTAGKAQWVSATGGPALIGEEHDAPAGHAYPTEACQWQHSPSPARGWRTTADNIVTRLAWSPSGYRTRLASAAPAIYVGSANWRTGELQGRNGGGAWATLCEIDLAVITGGVYTLAASGDTLTPAATTAAAARYFYRGELVGGTVVLTGGGNTFIARILENTEGVWRYGGGRVLAITIDVANGSGALPAADYAIDVWAPSGVSVAYNVVTAYDEYALLIDAQHTADNDYRTGIVLIGAYCPTGMQWSDGYSRETAPNIEIRRDQGGSARARKLGPPISAWTVAWTDGADQTALQSASPDPSWYSAAAAQAALANAYDAPELLAGLLETLEAGEVPVVVIGNVSSAGGTVTNSRSILYGYLVSPITREQILGQEASSEMLRVSSVRIEEIV